MKTLGYLGLGVMGYGMTGNLIDKSGCDIYGYDPVPALRERFAAAEATVDRAQELLDLADSDLEHYCATAREYYAEKNHPVFTEIEPQDYSEMFAAYREWHPVPDALIGGDNTR